MEIVNREVAAVIQATSEAEVMQVLQLDELQLALVGGGTGDIGWG